MRTVFTSRADVAHLWAHQLQDEARHRSGNFFFEGDTIYSYGHHYPCGTIVKNKHDKIAYVLNDVRYSNTTATHMGYVRDCIPWDAIVFDMKDCKSPHCYENSNGKAWNYGYDKAVNFVAHHLEKIFEFFQKQRKARTRSYAVDVHYHLNEIRNFIDFFDLDKSQVWCEYGGVKKKHPAIIDYFKSPKHAKTLKRVMNCSNEKFAYITQLVRVLDENSLLVGVRSVDSEGKRLWAIIQRFEKNGSFHHELALDLSGHQWKFNKYEDHVLTAGCHQIAYSECQAIANQMGW